jgi:energy-coupling factor transporter transmembrane protein EcfT
MPKINIITQLLAFFIFAIALNMLNSKALFITAALLFLALVMLKNRQFYRLTKRLRWFYLAMFLIFAFNTPGEHVVAWPFSISPTYEGLQAGLTQLLRITMMLATLSLVLVSNTKQQLISGFYFLFSPLKCVGLDVERFAARLWLTLHYVEVQQQVPKNSHLLSNLNHNLSAIFAESKHEIVEITLEKPRFSWLDYGLVALMLALMVVLMFKEVE